MNLLLAEDQLDQIPGVDFLETHTYSMSSTGCLVWSQRDKFLNLTWATYLSRMLSAFPTPKENTKYIGGTIRCHLS